MAQKVPNFKPFIPKESVKMAVQTLKSGWIGGDGPKVKEFEKKISQIINNNNLRGVYIETLNKILKPSGPANLPR